MSHSFVNENGYSVCTHCGITKETYYWNENQQKIEKFRNNLPLITQHQYIKPKWKSLLEKNTLFTIQNGHHIINELKIALNLFPFSPELKKNLYLYLVNKKFSGIDEAYKKLYNVICTLDLPITSKEFFKILQNDRLYKIKPLTKNYFIDSSRKYYWYITKLTEKAKEILNISDEETQLVYKIVFNYYNLIRFQMLKSTNPIQLIQNLVYYTVRERLQPNQQIFNKSKLLINNQSYIYRLITYIIEIKNRGLDSNFPIKLPISNRNMVLAGRL